MGPPREVSLKNPRRSDLIWQRYLGSNKCLFVWLFVCLIIDLFFILIIFGHPQKYTLKISWRSNLIWLRYSRSKMCLFVCFFVCLFVDLFVFYFNCLGTPTGIYPENFVKIWLDLAEILRIRKLDWRDRGEGEKKGSREGGEESYFVMV